MVTLKKYSLDGKEKGSIAVSDLLANAQANAQMVKDYIVALQANQRQWSASTKTRSEVAHTTHKPHPQKGGGRARQGSLVSPQYRGGGRVFGPKPKFDQHVRINKKERRAAIRFLLAEKIRSGQVIIIDSTEMQGPRTKDVAHFLDQIGFDGRVLFLGESNTLKIEEGDESFTVHLGVDRHDNFILSTRNLPKASFSLASNVNGYDVAVARHLVLTEPALQEIEVWLCS